MSELRNRIPDSELEVMMVIWDAGEPVNTDHILERLSNKDWTRQTLLKLLSRLEERGFVTYYKDGKYKMYSPTVRREKYLKEESKSFLDRMHFGSVTNLVATLYNGNALSDSDLAELETYIKETREGDKDA